MRQFVAAQRRVTLALAVVLLLLPLTLWGDSGANHQVYYTRPIVMGITGGNLGDINDFFCCSGTLGALVKNHSGGSARYILSNNHILARTNAASVGESIIQPGLVDEAPVCNTNSADTVATLTNFIPILFDDFSGYPPENITDAAIAETASGAVNLTGTIMDIGVPSNNPRTPGPGMNVKKSGRSTGLTTGSIQSVHVTVDVEYTFCGIDSQIARFVRTFIVNTEGFSDGGDSGSLIVENKSSGPRPLGLLFAGNGFDVTVAAPIQETLQALNVDLVGSGSGGSGSLWNIFLAFLRGPWIAQSHAQILQSTTTTLTDAVLPTVSDTVVLAASAVLDVNRPRLLNKTTKQVGVIGVGIGEGRIPGTAAIHVLAVKDTLTLRRALPLSIEGLEVIVVQTGKIVAQ